MAKISYKNFCNYDSGEAENKFFRVSEKGGAAAFAAAYPAKGSVVLSACERAVTVSTESFIRRPSLCDEAMKTITGFVNEGIYGMQEPRKKTLCSAAVLYIFRGKARCVTMGNSVILYFSDGKLVSAFEGKEDVLPGVSLREKFESEPEFDLKKGKNAFLIVSSGDKPVLDVSVIESGLQGSETAEDWIKAISPGLEGRRCSALAIDLPARKNGLMNLLRP